eukprot:gnl/TRDRNA2_/TRDRNA2_35525_c0_seq1.p1 gnl/TRDRNA2_/TRDRNA2_35525_c0~~gnl/TRDRNA2_/TRDRNA2_35525_c0_seq1.p1  ORF type:complete len:334 (-),score=122.56 gnl/TRDRNA2_/TRDRNA2_35525_c0_seq1:40-951(-)
MAEASDGSNTTLAGIAITALLGIFVALIVLVMRMTSAAEEEEKQAKGKEKGQKRRGALDRMQRGAATAGDDDDGDDADDGEDEGRAGRRNAAKDQKKKEKKEQQAQAAGLRAEREKGKSEKQQKYSAKQAEKEAERLKQEEAEKKAREEKEKKEAEEFDQWKGMFEVEEEGQGDPDGGDGVTAVEKFIEYVKVRKMVHLEDLAADFKMRTSACIDRLNELMKLGRLNGIFDDRGKFIYVTQEELENLSDWLKRKGRINRADLVATCNRVIRLNPTEDDKARLKEEARAALNACDAEGDGAEES